MNKIRLVPVLAFALLVVTISSCKKNEEKPYGGTGNTDLQVYVLNSNHKLISGASVSLFKSQANRDSGTKAINAGFTGAKGFVYFSELAPTTYYVSVKKGSKKGVGDTGVQILASGQSAITVVIQ